ncbi:MAG: hypothetical protein AVDCRST_MAG43-1007 [uncultured Thermomicrobiales bacterium]|uniref:Uncharacterized protein n=1 Tax=uncultured Thermomicrobiales bacterium TaxID=1645740 RepID=A0A6J4UGX9_9BACT|nr:MAG: hypothetical protein AVDCRST_MAG43-1007 [uncultured Thermomicrobiales bacterium]
MTPDPIHPSNLHLDPATAIPGSRGISMHLSLRAKVMPDV